MDQRKTIDLRKLRVEFAQRFSELIGDKNNPENLKNFHNKTGRPMPKLSQWRNPEHINWPDMKSFLQIAHSADVSPTWLLFGVGSKRLSLFWDPHVEQILQFMETCGESERRIIAEELRRRNEQKTAASSQERKGTIKSSSRKKAKGNL